MKAEGYFCVALILVWACAVDYAGAISGGETVQNTADYPFVVLVKQGRSMMCAGALISRSWVVTSASCVNKKNKRAYRFVLGENDRTVSDGELILKARQIIIHPKFNANTKVNDIALVQLRVPKGMNILRRPNIGKIALGVPSKKGKKPCVVTGWGQTVDNKGVISENEALQKAIVVRNDSCTIHSDFKNTIHMCYTAMIRVRNDNCDVHGDFNSAIKECYIDMESQVCKKDAGSPIACKVGGRYELVGIHRGGETREVCPNGPFIGTKIAPYIKWIFRFIRPQRKG